MAKTLLDGVNEALKRSKLIAGTSLATLTDSPRQTYIDVAVQAWNEAVEQLYSKAGRSMPKEMAESTIILVNNKRDYQLKTNLQVLYWPLHNRADGEYICEWTQGYHDLMIRQPQPAEYTGLATFGVIRPSDGYIYLDRIPTTVEAGKTFHYIYDKDVSLSLATDTFPFDDRVFRSLVPVVSEFVQKEFDRAFDDDLVNLSFGRASRALTRQPMRTSWLPR